MAVKPIPEGFHSVTPFLIIKGTRELIKFLQAAFEAKELFKMEAPDGAIIHAEVKIGDSIIMMGESSEKYPPVPAGMYVYVEDVDYVYKKAVAAGAVSTAEPADQFYGDRTAGVKDSFGNTWWIGTHIEDVSPEEMKKREEELMKKKSSN